MADKIVIQDLVAKGKVGHTPRERAKPQDIWVDLELETDTRKAAQTDALADTVDFVKVAAAVRDVMDQESYNLVETVAEKIAARLLKEFRIRRVTVRVKKKSLAGAAFAGVEIVR